MVLIYKYNARRALKKKKKNKDGLLTIISRSYVTLNLFFVSLFLILGFTGLSSVLLSSFGHCMFFQRSALLKLCRRDGSRFGFTTGFWSNFLKIKNSRRVRITELWCGASAACTRTASSFKLPSYRQRRCRIFWNSIPCSCELIHAFSASSKPDGNNCHHRQFVNVIKKEKYALWNEYCRDAACVPMDMAAIDHGVQSGPFHSAV